ncbi:hypothetical protein OBCHQ24_16350 [Oceanobacillus iheyensis]|nr:hypothetical protein OBCHQ24_16350 [Oceanobacillus iheyensis]
MKKMTKRSHAIEMKKIHKLLCIPVIAVTISLPQTAYGSSDLKGHYFEKSMLSLIEKGIIDGYSDGSYRPDRLITRAEFTMLLVRALHLPVTKATNPYQDIDQGDWYYEAIVTATSNNLIGGYPGNVFRPNKSISRQEMAAMIKRALDMKGVEAEKASLPFTDTTQINQMFIGAIESLVALQIVAGKEKQGNLYFAPLDHTTRGEMSAIFNRMLKQLDDEKLKISYSEYPYDFKQMIDIQVTRTPKVDGAGNFIASRSLVEYYANPNNFSPNSSDYLQFLDLSKQTLLDKNEINSKVLNNKGTLSGQAAAFIKAGKAYNVNEIYLMAHALHETGNGSSKLASGIPVDEKGNVVAQEKATRTVYNMYGYGAVDSNPINGGAKYAFQNKWFSPAEAIIGGAKDIANNYINDGQNTLYKMRWNPDSPGYPQYATHVRWAVLQTSKMQEIYSLLDSYVLHYDVPSFQKQPNAVSLPSAEEHYDVNTNREGQTMYTTANLNLRVGPTTSFNIIKTLVKGSRVSIIGENGGWYKISVDGNSGWVSGNYLSSNQYNILNRIIDSPSIEVPIVDSADHLFGQLTGQPPILYKEPTISISEDNIVKELPLQTDVAVLEIKGDWLLVTDQENEQGWVHKDNVMLGNLLKVQDIDTRLHIRETPSLEGKVIGSLEPSAYLVSTTTKDGQPIKEGAWYQVFYDGAQVWVHEDYVLFQDTLN